MLLLYWYFLTIVMMFVSKGESHSRQEPDKRAEESPSEHWHQCTGDNQFCNAFDTVEMGRGYPDVVPAKLYGKGFAVLQ